MHHLEDDRETYRLIYMIEEGVYGVLLSEGAFASKVRYTAGGLEYDGVYVGNDEFLERDEMIEEED
ncbi:hypothetical protein PP459_gp122 [Streptomyces phage Wakanda]|uniref:Uncharacterized protein n=2 Tax=Wakandavirus TaxID=3044854 RepID=A0A6G8R3C8_9CAUD|nr:hypothetical protein PP459_gp122 [Streptomyces phage Wakanda]YP_010652432.1 hypothetical protein PP460_gp126 [Streptomyces phage Muntaha]QIN94111.1 hypothetical protein SEA_WAKANDA_144 [Streptomyces phage Wakanda]QIN94676.1 hypothetical protein SEA_MUNTAHA_145 [Streptomyces phage Muntaha]